MKAVGVLVVLAAAGAVAKAQPAADPPAADPPAVATSAGPGLKLEDAIQLALHRNERARIAELDITVAEAAVSRARAAFLPVLSANGNDTLHLHGDPTNTAQAALNLNQPLISPSAWPLYGQAKHQLAGARAQSADDKRQIAFDAASAFINVLLRQEVLKAAQRRLETAKADLADTDAQVKAQLVSSNDVTRAQIGLSSSAREVANDQGTVDDAYVQLGFLINQRVTGGLQIPAELLTAGVKPLATADHLVAASLQQRPDLVARKEAALAAHDFAAEPRMRWFPTLGFNGQLAATTVGDNDHVDGSIALVASWTLFDAGIRTADARSRDAQAEISDLQAVALVRQVDTQVRSAAVSLVAAQQALLAANDAVVAARKSADETAILYHQQLAKAIELLDANEQRFSAEVDYAVAQFSVANAYLALRQAMGLEPIGDLP
ncbi:MAG TPA: TolC family protein [Kofleriaceae bacterium]